MRRTPRRRTTQPATIPAGSLPPLYNSEIANQGKLDVAINSTRDYDDNTDYSDGATRAEQRRPVLQAHDRRQHLRAGLLDGCEGEGARSPVALRRRIGAAALAERRPRPGRDPARDQRHAVPAARGAEQHHHEGAGSVLRRVPRHESPESDPRAELKPLPDADQAAWTAAGGGTLWGDPELGNPTSGAATTVAFPLTLPAYDPQHAADYLADRYRSGSRVGTSIDLNSACSALSAPSSRTASHALADPDLERRQARQLSRGHQCSSDRRLPATGCVLSALPVGATNCKYGVTVEVNWGNRVPTATRLSWRTSP